MHGQQEIKKIHKRVANTCRRNYSYVVSQLVSSACVIYNYLHW